MEEREEKWKNEMYINEVGGSRVAKK